MPSKLFCNKKEVKGFKAYAFEYQQDLNRDNTIILEGFTTAHQIILDYFHNQTPVDIEVTSEGLPIPMYLRNCLIKGIECIVERPSTKMKITLTNITGWFPKQREPFIFR